MSPTLRIYGKCQKCGSEMKGIKGSYFLKTLKSGEVLAGGTYYCSNKQCNWMSTLRFDNHE